ncbi:DUF305 domain-containing protein [Amycolatopsis sp. FBCC-B4732]|uniref:DUF305 domain-containing protein n=1 Tax=Amycolatopsis sp. FBCC-B4732 TaxID=3079339 RepID=UPI001FF23BC4|nr:DUF305 domain-containing protein [Amycolatopsis sp. FBCC-B4732]UOX90574.1 DUF305 domain-containing protein [Amycolatopsis sp. FBCC-B4732]
MRKKLFLGALAVASAAVLGACSSNDSMSGMESHSSAPAPAPASGPRAGHNADDVTFARQMIPHHSQALDMAKLVPTRSTNPKVVDLAGRIEKAQDPEIKLMQGWLSTWGASATSTMPGMTAESMPGMMSADDMTKLDAAKGTEFDRAWLDMMINHHRGAVGMAEYELSRGSNPDAKALAQKIIDAQQAEITEMQGLLQQS